MIMSGANGYLVKNSGAEQLVEAIVAIHRTGMYYPDLATKHFYEKIRSGQVPEPEISQAERQFLSLLAAGMRYDVVAQKMGISMLELEKLRDELSTRLGVNTRAGLVLFAVQTGIVPLEIDTSGLAVQ
jgi:DNA-binding NarL/FixJ family response regulator